MTQWNLELHEGQPGLNRISTNELKVHYSKFSLFIAGDKRPFGRNLESPIPANFWSSEKASIDAVQECTVKKRETRYMGQTLGIEAREPHTKKIAKRRKLKTIHTKTLRSLEEIEEPMRISRERVQIRRCFLGVSWQMCNCFSSGFLQVSWCSSPSDKRCLELILRVAPSYRKNCFLLKIVDFSTPRSMWDVVCSDWLCMLGSSSWCGLCIAFGHLHTVRECPYLSLMGTFFRRSVLKMNENDASWVWIVCWKLWKPMPPSKAAINRCRIRRL